MRDCLRLYRRVDHNPLEILGRDRARLVRHRKALLDEGHQLLLAQALAPACQRRAVERGLMTEAQLAAKELEYGFSIHRAQRTSSDRLCMCLRMKRPVTSRV